MLKLYKLFDGERHYWETWEENEQTGIMHWGKVGDIGQSKEVTSGFLSNFKSTIQKEIAQKLLKGYAEIKEEHGSFLEIQYRIDGFGSPDDLNKRHRLEAKMNEDLGWTGLGYCDGGSIGSDSMEVGCIVVDFELAKRIIEEKLKDTEFADYSGIVRLDSAFGQRGIYGRNSSAGSPGSQSMITE